MPDMPLIDIRPDHWEIVQRILRQYVPQHAVWAFGSRAKWSAKPYSDLDLAIIADKPLSLDVITSLSDDFAESDLPWKVDIVDWATTSESFRKIIERDKVVVLEGENDLGSEWQTLSLAEVYDFSSGLSKPRSAFGSGHPFLSFKDVFYNSAVPKQLTELVQSTEQERARCSVMRGDVFLTRTSETMGELGMSSVALADIPDATFNGFTKRLRPKRELIAPGFARYFFRSSEFRAAINSMSTMSTRASLNNEMLERLTITFPEYAEQRAIAHILGTLDDKIELNRQQNETLEAMARALFKAWFVDFEPVRAKLEGRWQRGQSLPGLPAQLYDLFPDRLVESELGEIPEGWYVTNFGAVSACFDKYRIPLSSKQRETRKGNVPYHGATSVMDFVNEAIFDGIYLLLGEDGSVLKEDGAPFVQYIWGKSWVNNHAHVLQGKNGVSTEQLMLFVSSQNITAYVTGAVQLKLNQKNMNSIPFIKSGDEINAEFAERIAPLYEQFRQLTEQSRSLAQLRDTLLPKLISGELRIPDAEAFLKERGL